jgi:hypothetical protein
MKARGSDCFFKAKHSIIKNVAAVSRYADFMFI